MDRMVKTNIAGLERYLHYSMDVLFDVRDKYGSLDSLLDIIEKDDREAFEALTWITVRMANDGELCRRMQGYDHNEILKDEDVNTLMSPYEYMALKNAVATAVHYGYQREIPDDEQKEIDLGLQELEEKNRPAGA